MAGLHAVTAYEANIVTTKTPIQGLFAATRRIAMPSIAALGVASTTFVDEKHSKEGVDLRRPFSKYGVLGHIVRISHDIPENPNIPP